MNTDQFIYKKSAGITALSASFTDFGYKMHYHEEYALGVTLRGIQQYNLGGSLQSSYQNGVMLFNPEQAHDGWSKDKSGIDYVIVYIHPKLFLEVLGKKDMICFPSPIVYNSKLEQSILNLTQAIFNNQDESLCSELLLALADNSGQTDIGSVDKKDDALTKKAKEMIDGGVKNVLRLDDICQKLGVSKYRFIRSFKANTGISPYQYFLNCKVELAKKIIGQNRDVYLAVTECGFVELTHLNKHFKRVYGVTAFEYLSYLNL